MLSLFGYNRANSTSMLFRKFGTLNKTPLSGAKAVYNGLLNNNVKDVFMYSGGAIMPLVDLFKNNNTQINYYVNNHEQNCGHAATGYAKSTGKTGVAIVTSGPGLTNMVTPILDATNDSTPLVVFSGQVPRSAMGTLAFQECPATEITKPCTKWSYCVKEGDDLFDTVNEAFRVANTGKKGAVHIDLPKCSSTRENGINKININNTNNNNTNNNNNYNYRLLHKLITESKCPIVSIGKGANGCPEELYEFVKKYNLYVTSTIHAMGTFNENDELSLGFLGMHGFPVANHAMQNADLIIALGSRFDDRTTGNISKYAPACINVIHVNIENSELGKIIDTRENREVHKINMDCGEFLRNMNNIKSVNHELVNNNRIEWSTQIKSWRQRYPITYIEPPNNKLNTQIVIEQINKLMDHKNSFVTTGVGNHQMMSAQFIRWTNPNQFITSGSLGVMGVGLPYAIGVQIANPNKTVIDIDGDGSFNHTLADLQTVFKYKLPIKIFVMNDGHMSMVRAWEKLFYNENYVATDCSHNPDYCALAKSYGIHSVVLDNKNDLHDVVKYVLDYKGPILCNAKVETDLCLPLVAPGKALNEMITIDSYHQNTKLTGMAPS
jgi:acetolactate synthase-1/2/3 large subunit